MVKRLKNKSEKKTPTGTTTCRINRSNKATVNNSVVCLFGTKSHRWQWQHPNISTATICVKYFTPDLDANLFTFLFYLYLMWRFEAVFARECVRALGWCGFGVFALINHQMLVIGLTLRVNISISDWQRVIYTITSKIDWYVYFFSRSFLVYGSCYISNC